MGTGSLSLFLGTLTTSRVLLLNPQEFLEIFSVPSLGLTLGHPKLSVLTSSPHSCVAVAISPAFHFLFIDRAGPCPPLAETLILDFPDFHSTLHRMDSLYRLNPAPLHFLTDPSSLASYRIGGPKSCQTELHVP